MEAQEEKVQQRRREVLRRIKNEYVQDVRGVCEQGRSHCTPPSSCNLPIPLPNLRQRIPPMPACQDPNTSIPVFPPMYSIGLLTSTFQSQTLYGVANLISSDFAITCAHLLMNGKERASKVVLTFGWDGDQRGVQVEVTEWILPEKYETEQWDMALIRVQGIGNVFGTVGIARRKFDQDTMHQNQQITIYGFVRNKLHTKQHIRKSAIRNNPGFHGSLAISMIRDTYWRKTIVQGIGLYRGGMLVIDCIVLFNKMQADWINMHTQMPTGSLYLSNCLLSDTDIHFLSLQAWPNLTSLYLNQNNLSNQGLLLLGKLHMPRLRLLDIHGNKYDKAGVLEFIQKLQFPQLMEIFIGMHALKLSFQELKEGIQLKFKDVKLM